MSTNYRSINNLKVSIEDLLTFVNDDLLNNTNIDPVKSSGQDLIRH